MHNADIELFKDGKRVDGRKENELRKPLRIEAGVLSSADGSALIEWGKNKIVVGVYGPRDVVPKHEASPYKALVKARYSMLPFASKEEHGRHGMSRRSIELSKVISDLFDHLVLAGNFPKTEIDIFIEVLQAEGGTRVASVTAATVALINAGIPLKKMVAGVAAGKVAGRVVLDLSKIEDNYGEADFPVAMSEDGEIFLWQMDGKMTKEEVIRAMDYCEKAIKHLIKMQKEALTKAEKKKENKLTDCL